MSHEDSGASPPRSTPPSSGVAVLVLAAPSGTGKTTVARRLLDEYPDLFRFSVSATTRNPRGTEQNGTDYHFLNEDEFRAGIAAGRFLEWAEVHGRLYGTPWSELEAEPAGSRVTLLDIDVQGALQVRERVPGATLVFLLPPSGPTLVRRLRARGTDDDAEVLRRLEGALAELDQAEHFDYVVENDDLDTTVQTVKSLAKIARLSVRPSAVPERVEELKEEIRESAEATP